MQFLSVQKVPKKTNRIPCAGIRTSEAPAPTRRGSGSPFATLLRPADWRALPAAVRKRFGDGLASGESTVYRGCVTDLTMSRLGWLLAQALRLAGAPLPFDIWQKGQAATVSVTANPLLGGQVWTRLYGRRGGFPHVVHSAKRFAGPTGLEELLPGGFGMALTLRVKAQTLEFCSAGYFVTLFGRRFALPDLLSPGALTVGHRDLGGGAFEFTLDLRHPRFGPLIRQTARFHDMEDLSDD